MLTFRELAPERPLLLVELPAAAGRPERRIVLRDAYCEALDCPGCRTECELSYEDTPTRINRMAIDPVTGEYELSPDAPAHVVADVAELVVGRALWSLLERFQAVQAWKLAQRDALPTKAESRLYHPRDFLERSLPTYLAFEHGGDLWVAHDLYCVNPECSCLEANLQLNRVPREPTRAPLEFSLWLDLATNEPRRTEDNRALGKPEVHALASLREAHGQLRSVLELRRRLVRDLAAKRLAFALDHTWPGAPAVSIARIGRNDPCPCGSGKKHKRCCG